MPTGASKTDKLCLSMPVSNKTGPQHFISRVRKGHGIQQLILLIGPREFASMEEAFLCHQSHPHPYRIDWRCYDYQSCFCFLGQFSFCLLVFGTGSSPVGLTLRYQEASIGFGGTRTLKRFVNDPSHAYRSFFTYIFFLPSKSYIIWFSNNVYLQEISLTEETVLLCSILYGILTGAAAAA
ncbi:hypothetical protein ACJX0J_031091 [Zea mays]